MFMLMTPWSATPGDLRDLREHVELICEAAGLSSLEKLALAIDMDEAQLNRQLKGEGHLSLTRVVCLLGRQVPGFWSRYGWLLACRFGVPQEARRSAWMVLGQLGRKRQLKMAAPSTAQKRSA